MDHYVGDKRLWQVKGLQVQVSTIIPAGSLEEQRQAVSDEVAVLASYRENLGWRNPAVLTLDQDQDI